MRRESQQKKKKEEKKTLARMVLHTNINISFSISLKVMNIVLCFLKFPFEPDAFDTLEKLISFQYSSSSIFSHLLFLHQFRIHIKVVSSSDTLFWYFLIKTELCRLWNWITLWIWFSSLVNSLAFNRFASFKSIDSNQMKLNHGLGFWNLT